MRLHLRREQDHWTPRLQSKLRAQPFAMRPRALRRSSEKFVVHCVGHRENSAGFDAVVKVVLAIQPSDREDGVNRAQQRRHRDSLDAEFQRVVGLAQQIGLAAEHHRDIERLRRRDSRQASAMRIAVNPQRVEAAASQPRAQPERPWPPERESATRANARQKLMPVAVEQRHVPFHVHAEAGVAIRVDREIAQEKNRQLDSRHARQCSGTTAPDIGSDD